MVAVLHFPLGRADGVYGVYVSMPLGSHANLPGVLYHYAFVQNGCEPVIQFQNHANIHGTRLVYFVYTHLQTDQS